MILGILFAGAALLALYPYVGYPLVLSLITIRRKDPTPPADPFLPSLSIVMAAHNESPVIRERIRNLLAADYPLAVLQILVGSDGSDDSTVTEARAACSRGDPVLVLDFPDRRGKAAVVDDLISRATGDIVVMSDANTAFAPDALRSMARWFADPAVGCVVGQLELITSEGRGAVERDYWRLETHLKRLENRISAVLGANGAIYAFRRDAYVPLPANAITDDFVLPLLIRERGRRIIFDPSARAREEAPPSVRDEFRRRVRIGTGNVQALRLTRGLLHPRWGWTAFAYWSHKVLRWLAPISLTAALGIAIAQSNRPFYAIMTGGAAVMLALSAGGWLMERAGRRPWALLSAPYAFVALNAALLIGALRYFRHPDGRWERTPRTGGLPSVPTKA